MARTHNLFISHVHEDDAEVQNLKGMLAKNGYSVRDSSIDSSKPNNAQSPEYIKSQILAPRIQWAGTLVVIISSSTHRSDWVNWEIEYAQKQGKRIVGIYIRGGKESDLPEAFKKYGDALVGWNSDNLMGAIRGEHNNLCQPTDSGSYILRSPQWGLQRFGC